MATKRTTRQAYARLKELVRNSPGVEQDLSKWYDVVVTEIEPGQWKMEIDTGAQETDIIYFSYWELSVNDIYAAQGMTEDHPKRTDFKPPLLVVDTPKTKALRQEKGAMAGLTPDELQERVKIAEQAAAKFKPPIRPEPEETLWSQVKKLVRMIRLRMRL